MSSQVKNKQIGKIQFEDVIDRIMTHVLARKWDEIADSRGLAISLSLEANELLKYYQWSDKNFGSKEDLASEVADIFIYLAQFAHSNDIDILQAVLKKLEKSAKKYPVEISEIEDVDERNKAWLEAKQKYQKDTTL